MSAATCRDVALCLGSADGRERSIEVWRLRLDGHSAGPAPSGLHRGSAGGSPARLGAVAVAAWDGWAPDLALHEAAGMQLISTG